MPQDQTLLDLFSGFEGHNAPTSDAVDAALQGTSLMISVDTNVLLGLYRLSDERSASLRRGLREHASQLFLSHQAQVEFWRNRESVLSDRTKARDEAVRMLGKASETARSGLQTWAKAVSVDHEDLSQALVQVDRQLSILTSVVSDQHKDDTANYPSPGDDLIVRELSELFAGRVGRPDLEDIQQKNVTEGKRRHAAHRPPGYKEKEEDKQANPEGVSGDYLVWRQSIDEAKRRGHDLLIVTADEKEDWYWKVRGTPIGARHELALEFHDETGRRLFMLTPLQLDSRWRALAGNTTDAPLTTDSPTLDEIDEIDDIDEDGSEAAQDRGPVQAEWNETAVHALLKLLAEQAPVQAAVIEDAARTGGRIERARLYEVANYPRDRMLRGFTRPISRLTRLLQERGDLPLNVPDFLVPRYDYSVEANAFDLVNQAVPWVASYGT